MRILGLGGSDHDIASCIVENGEVVIAIEDERVSRCKYGLGSNFLLGKSRKYCCDARNLSVKEFDMVIADEILVDTATFGLKDVLRIDHHLAHASSCFFPSNFEESAILVVDNAGSMIENKGIETISYGVGHGNKVELLQSIFGGNWNLSKEKIGNKVYQFGDCDNSLGHFYKVVSGCLGFKYSIGSGDYFYPEAGKTMGLSSYGDDRYYDELSKFIKYGKSGKVEIKLTDGALKNHINNILKTDSRGKEFACKANIAFAAQKIIEEAMVFCGTYLYEKTHNKNLCLSGGVALNCVANGKLRKKLPFQDIFLFPACGDNGTAVGCAYYGYYNIGGNDRIKSSASKIYYGKKYSEDEIAITIEKYKDKIVIEEDKNYISKVAEHITEGKVIGWFQGESEFGPRALGHRSILADPRRDSIKNTLNEKVKHRETFRPFAPSVLLEKAGEYFEEPYVSPYMLLAGKIKGEVKKDVPGAVHVDGTARYQTVTLEENGNFYKLIKKFFELTGVPMIINTSFNVRGQPIVETPEDALKCFLETNIDVLVFENIIITKKGEKKMSKKDILEKLKVILTEVCDVETAEIDLECHDFCERYGINSIVALEFLLEVEKKFGIEIEDDDLSEELLEDINYLVNYIENKMVSGSV